MTDVGTAIAYLLDSHGYGDAGVTIFANSRPSTPHALIACTQYGGQSPTMPMGGGTPTVVSPNLQLVVRGNLNEDFDVVYDRIYGIWLYLAGLLDVTLQGERYLHITPIDLPALMLKDDQERLLFVANFNIIKE